MNNTREITSHDDRIDLRDLSSRVDYLEFLEDDDLSDEDREFWADEIEELSKLRALISEVENEADDWPNGQLIAAHEIEEYAKEYAREIHGSQIDEGDWPYDSIDWEAAADDLFSPRPEVEFDGQKYYVAP